MGSSQSSRTTVAVNKPIRATSTGISRGKGIRGQSEKYSVGRPRVGPYKNIFAKEKRGTEKTSIRTEINKVNTSPGVSLPATITVRTVPDKSTIIPDRGMNQPQFIGTLSNPKSPMKSVLARSMDAQNQIRVNVQRETRFSENAVLEQKRASTAAKQKYMKK